MILINVNNVLENINMKYFITSFRFWSKNVTSTLNEHIILLLKQICSTCNKLFKFKTEQIQVLYEKSISVYST
jgi:hypothetical protein